jgi:class 3 adenylate cyclase/tetratricopeptide (TPR) repeat protein
MDFYEALAQVIDLLEREQRVSYRALKRQFGLDDDYIEDLKDELIKAKRLAVDEDGAVLVWTGDATQEPTPRAGQTEQPAKDQERDPTSYTPQHLADKILTSRSALEGERKQVTVMFCDLANSTALAERIGPEAMHTLLNHFFELSLAEVHRYEGTINQFLGDGFMALFGAPIAHEDHARRGTLAALALQHTLQEHHAELGEPHSVTCQFRIGLNSGLVVVGSIGDNLRMDYSAVGDTTNLASRLQGIAEPGDTLVSESTSRLVEGHVRLEALEPVTVKGKTEPVPVFKAIGIFPRWSPVVSRGERALSEFVGRERELAVLDELFEQVASGHGQVVGVVAEAGQGKSRLLYEFRQRLQDNQVTYLEGRCLSYGSSIPYHPILDVVRNNCGITENDSTDAIRQKIRLSLEEVGMGVEESAPYLLQLLGVKEGTESIAQLTPEAVRNRTFDALKQMILKGSQQRPLIVEIEDVHWVDNTSENYLASLVESLAGASILLLTTYRPGYQPSWLGKSYATQISLHSLAQRDGLSVVHSVLHGEKLPDPMEQMITEKAEGNPFFLEELTRAVVERGETEADSEVPDTIQGVLSARIDRLPEEPKRLLQTASVLGREFSPILLKAIWEGSASIDSLLVELKRLELLYERTGAEGSLYVFKHALTQDVAYESLLTTRRQTLHAAAGQALETLYADHLEDAYDRLAYHYSNTDNAAKAVGYLTQVAENSARGYAHTEAVVTLQEALVHAERLPEAERDQSVVNIAVRQADSLFFLGRRQELVERLLGQQELLERLQDPLLTGLYYLELGHAYSFLGKRQEALQSLQCALEAGKRGDDAVTMGRAHNLLTVENGFAGHLQAAICHGEQAVTLLVLTTEQYWLGRALHYLGAMYIWAGQFLRSLETAMKLQTLGEKLDDYRLQVNALEIIGWSYITQGEWEAAIEAIQDGLAISPDAFEAAVLLGHLGHAYLEKSDVAKAVSTLEQAVEQAQQYRSRQVQSWFKTYLGEAYRLDGRIKQAHDLAYQGFQLAQDAEHPWGIALAKRTLGRIAQTNDNLAEANRYFQEALSTFSLIQARFDLARTHLDLASLAHTQNNPDNATEHLCTAYAWFNKLQVPKWVKKTEQLAREYGITLTEVELEELTKDSL